MSETLESICQEFWENALASYKFYLDAFRGLELLREDIKARHHELILEHRRTNPGQPTMEPTEESTFIPYLKTIEDQSEPGKPQTATGITADNLKNWKKRNVESGLNYQEFLHRRNFLLVGRRIPSPDRSLPAARKEGNPLATICRPLQTPKRDCSQ